CALSSFFFHDPLTPEIYTLSLHDALPISLAEHRWVAELIRSIATVAHYAHVYDEGAYYHTLEIEDAAEAIHANGLLINSLGAKLDRKSTRLNSSHSQISYAVFCLKKKK